MFLQKQCHTEADDLNFALFLWTSEDQEISAV